MSASPVYNHGIHALCCRLLAQRTQDVVSFEPIHFKIGMSKARTSSLTRPNCLPVPPGFPDALPYNQRTSGAGRLALFLSKATA